MFFDGLRRLFGIHLPAPTYEGSQALSGRPCAPLAGVVDSANRPNLLDGRVDGGDLMSTATLYRLTGKQEQFARAFVELGSAAAAYRRIYATRPDLPGSTVWPEASRIRNLPNVAASIAQLRERHAEQTGVTIDTLSGQLQQAYALALAHRQPSAAVTATMALAKLHGLFVDRAEVKARAFVVSDTPEGLVVEDGPPEPMSEAGWEEKNGRAG